MEPSSAIIGYEYDKDTEVCRIITLESFNDEMGEFLRVFSTWKDAKGALCS